MNKKKISLSTVIRTALLVLALINQVLVVLDMNPLPFENEQVEQLISLIFTIITSCLAWWKNNSFSKAAIEADEIMKKLKEDETHGTE